MLHYLPGERRPVKPGDLLIFCFCRNPPVSELISTLFHAMSLLLHQNGCICLAFGACRNTPYSVKQVLFWQWIALWEQNIQSVSFVSSLLLVQGRRKFCHINSSGLSGLMWGGRTCPSGCDIARKSSCLLDIAGY